MDCQLFRHMTLDSERTRYNVTHDTQDTPSDRWRSFIAYQVAFGVSRHRYIPCDVRHETGVLDHLGLQGFCKRKVDKAWQKAA